MALVLVDRPAVGGAQRGLEQRVHERGRDGGVRHLVVARSGPGVADHPVARRVVARLPRQLDAWFAARAPAGVHRLAAADQRHVELAPLDARAQLVAQQLRAVAADGRHHGGARLDAELAAEQRARIGIPPRPDRCDPDHVHPVEQRVRGRCVGVGEACRVGEQVDRRARLGGGHALRHLPDADDDG